jgi:replicative DNA helicase
MRRSGKVMAHNIYTKFDDLTVDVLDTIEDSAKKIRSLLTYAETGIIKQINVVFQEAIADMESIDSDILLAEFDLPEINECIIGATAGDNTIIAARPGAGKTSLVMQELRHMSLSVPVGLVTIEMTAKQLMYREISSITGISMRKLISKQGLSTKEIAIIKELMNHFKERIFIVDSINSLKDLRVSVMKLIEYYGVKVWALDYIQLVNHESIYKTKNNTVEEISKECKYISKSSGTHGIILSQLSRDSEKGATVRAPRLSDLKDSGAIEADATNVLMIYRPESQGVKEDTGGESLEGRAKIIVAKSRNGKTETIKVGFDGERYKFFSLAESSSNDQIELEIPY